MSWCVGKIVGATVFACLLAPPLSANGWYRELLNGDDAWLDAFPPPSRPTQTVISLSPPKVLEFVKVHSLNIPHWTPPLITMLSFDDWASLLWTAAHDRPAFPVLTKSLVTRARETQQEDLFVGMAIRNELTMKEKMFVDMWGAESAFHSGLVFAEDQDGPGTPSSQGEDDDEGLCLTEEEKAYHAQMVAESKVEVAKPVEENQKSEVNKYTRNAFLPLASSRWVESESVKLDYKVWELPTYNHSAPISSDSYRFLANLTQEEMRLCNDKSLSENIELVRGNYPLTAADMNFPLIGEIDRAKCVVTRPALAVRGFLGAKGQLALVELKRIWNVGRPYLKCRCIQEGKGDCKKNITWLDHVLWHMREIMESMAFNVLSDPSRRPDNILDDRALLMHKFPRTMAHLILPPRFVTDATHKKRKSMMADARARRTKEARQTTLSFSVRPQGDHSPVAAAGASGVNNTPPESCVSTQADGQTSECEGSFVNDPSGRRRWQKSGSKGMECFVHLRYVSRIMATVHFRSILEKTVECFFPEAVALLSLVLIGWSYMDTLESLVYKPAKVFHDFSLDDWMGFCAKSPKCPCNTDRFSPFHHPCTFSMSQPFSTASTHTLSMDPAVSSNLRLRNLLKQGLNHIPPQPRVVAPALHKFMGAWEVIKQFIARKGLMRTSGIEHADRYISDLLKRQLAIPSLRRCRDSACDTRRTDVNDEITFLTNRVFIAGTDKAGNTPSFVCVHLIRTHCYHGWLTSASFTFLTPVAALCDAVLKCITPLVMAACKEITDTLSRFHGIETSIWWSVESVQDYCWNLPEKVYSVFSADITRCFETIPIDESVDGLPDAINLFTNLASSMLAK
ncbi:hypothetical protein CBR_g45319 [Chara braunii]|uniref:Uncharacterized protein n=1 Tax=Chara braunii TaxID=69332 RepID=A0A388LYH4_CHABU|nr:hypothetical protein CBR_g45319 [Chara braunii]|eukprot:GBG87259.1 hypothetical protein CBR_g45319 [Chara braunii]